MSLSLPLENKNRTIYFDNAATSWPKPEKVVQSILYSMTEGGGNPGRSGHSLAIAAGEDLFSFRDETAQFFALPNPMRVIPCFSGTDALNLAIQGLLVNGGHVVTTSMEHNSTIRPLKEMEKRGIISLSVLKCSSEGLLDNSDLKKALTTNTSLIVVNHGSNVFGTVQNIRDIGRICRSKGIPFLVDASQTAGVIPIDIEADNIDLLAFAGHKGLYGPTGTGALLISENFDYKRIKPFRYGGTGSNSDKIIQPDFLPDIFESGTLNISGLAGLTSGMQYIRNKGINSVFDEKKALIDYFIKKSVKYVKGFITYINPSKISTGVVSFNIKGLNCSETSMYLSEEFNIMSRSGLHCAPFAHKTFNTFPNGTVRFSFGAFNNINEIDEAVDALNFISRNRSHN